MKSVAKKLADWLDFLKPPTTRQQIVGSINFFFIRKQFNPEKVSTFNKIHSGTTIYVVGGGASLLETDLEKLNGKVVIFCNRSVKLMKEFSPRYAYWITGTPERVRETVNYYLPGLDAKFISAGVGWDRFDLQDYLSSNDVLLLQASKIGLFRVVKDKKHKFSTDLSRFIGLAEGRSIIFSAIQLAHYMGASRIVLLGVDMGVRDSLTSHYDGDENRDQIVEYASATNKALSEYLEILRHLGVSLVNSSKWTNDTVLPREKL